MKSLLKCFPLLTVTAISLLAGCNEKPIDPSTFDFANYEVVSALPNETAVADYISSVNNNDADENGVILSPYHTIKVNGIDMPLYASRTALGIHSFIYLNVNEEKVNLTVEITSTVKQFKSVEVLPLTSGISGKVNGSITTAKLNDFGSFSFAFNGKSEYPLTVFVAKKEQFVLPEGYQLKEISPKEKVGETYPVFAPSETKFTAQRTAYYFKKGHYKIHEISLPSNSVFYFEPGVYLEDYLIGDTLEAQKLDYTAFMYSSGAENIQIYGNPLIDFSCHWGGPAGHKSKGHFSVSSCTNIKMDGAIFINASSWQMCFTNCKDIEVSDCMLYGYKTCSDGIMLSDCKRGHVHHNFVRTGDDAIEAKSTGSAGGEELIYEYNAVWADKARCYGVIYESNKDAHNIIFRKNSIGFSQGAWTDDVGALAVIMGTNKNTNWYDIHFEDIEIYSLKSHAMCMSICAGNSFGWQVKANDGGQAHDIYYKNIKVYNKFIQHAELLYMRVEEGCSLKNVKIENVQYMNSKSKMTKFAKEDLDNILMTECWTWNQAKPSSIAEVK